MSVAGVVCGFLGTSMLTRDKSMLTVLSWLGVSLHSRTSGAFSGDALTNKLEPHRNYIEDETYDEELVQEFVIHELKPATAVLGTRSAMTHLIAITPSQGLCFATKTLSL